MTLLFKPKRLQPFERFSNSHEALRNCKLKAAPDETSFFRSAVKFPEYTFTQNKKKHSLKLKLFNNWNEPIEKSH